MIKNFTRIEHKIGDRIFHFSCDQDSPINEVKEALFQFLGHISNIERAELEKINSLSEENKKEES